MYILINKYWENIHARFCFPPMSELLSHAELGIRYPTEWFRKTHQKLTRLNLPRILNFDFKKLYGKC